MVNYYSMKTLAQSISEVNSCDMIIKKYFSKQKKRTRKNESSFLLNFLGTKN